ncbi:ATPase [Streptomyces sp. NPDC127106]|uniref:RapZ C-terminal domain-containing protein n=1 Tax=Streptomyces sp. NPDC127106 TaxID=3345360 RepID=UPI00363B518F
MHHDVRIISFGYLHGPAPEANITLDLRTHFRDPNVDSKLKHLTARDEAVRRAVRSTEGIREMTEAAADMVEAFLNGPAGEHPVTVAVGCAGGRHRAASVALDLAHELDNGRGLVVTVLHRDILLDVVDR